MATMTSRERWLALLEGRTPDRIPTDYWATGEVTRRLLAELNCTSEQDLLETLHIDRPISLGARRTVTEFPGDPEADIWGVRHRMVDYGSGQYSEADSHPLAEARSVEEIHAFPWPDPDAHDWDDFHAQVKALDGKRLVRCGGYEPFLRYCQMRGMEQAYMDLATEPDIAEAIFQHLFEYHYHVNRTMLERADGAADIIYLAEDLGSQESLLMSREMIAHYILPNLKRMAEMARGFGCHIFYHSDGAIRPVIRDLIDVVGVEMLNPIQWRCAGMERGGLVRDFGGELVFHGAVDNQQTLAFGSADDVRDEVLENIRIFSGSRWVCAPCHNIQPVSPTENIVAMYETIHEHGRL